MKKLVLVESPTKAKTLSRFLGEEYQIEATYGHIRDLPEKRLGIKIKEKENYSQGKSSLSQQKVYDFFPEYRLIAGRKKKMEEIKRLAQEAEKIILATDPDREGEAIAFHLKELLAPKISSAVSDKFWRIVFHEITPEAVKNALLSPRGIDKPLVEAQQARRILDRLVGYKLSPLLWNKLGKNWLSAGRVQSVAVRLMVEREKEREKFLPEEYWKISVKFLTQNGKEITAALLAKNQQRYEEEKTLNLFDGKYTVGKTTITSKSEAEKIIRDFQAPFLVKAVEKKEVRRFPPPPFTTSTLQQEAGRRFFFSAKKTMQLAQKLYEEGIITYHRTDSFNLSEKFLREVRLFLKNSLGEEYLPKKPRLYKTKSKVAQEAHEAIRPTSVLRQSLEKEGKDFHKDHRLLYELIWKRAVASQAKEAVFTATTFQIESANGYQFRASGSVLKFPGFLKISPNEGKETFLPEVSVGEELKLKEAIPSQHFTLPPPFYTEATLVKALEEKGIGRPSTYAPIISTILARKYVEKKEGKLRPTDLGKAVTEFLVRHFPQILDLPFTALMEDSLDEIANGHLSWEKVLSDFYGPFQERLEKVFTQEKKVKLDLGKVEESCPLCGASLVVRLSRYGKFLACSQFPKCRFTKNFLEKVGIKCPRCGGEIVLKKTKKGKSFYGCSRYPQCQFAAWRKEDIR